RRVRAVRGISETQQTVRRVRRLRDFVLVGIRDVHAELDVVRPDDLGHIVAEGERRVRIQRAVRNVAWVFGKSVLTIVKLYAGHLAAEAIVIEPKASRNVAPLPWTGELRGDVIRGIAG